VIPLAVTAVPSFIVPRIFARPTFTIVAVQTKFRRSTAIMRTIRSARTAIHHMSQANMGPARGKAEPWCAIDIILSTESRALLIRLLFGTTRGVQFVLRCCAAVGSNRRMSSIPVIRPEPNAVRSSIASQTVRSVARTRSYAARSISRRALCNTEPKQGGVFAYPHA